VAAGQQPAGAAGAGSAYECDALGFTFVGWKSQQLLGFCKGEILDFVFFLATLFTIPISLSGIVLFPLESFQILLLNLRRAHSLLAVKALKRGY
jgi:hypothetical protein